jgi:hypothetical protein
MCESSKSKGLARCPCEVGDVRRGLILLCLGWAGDQREFSKEDKGWRLGNGIIVTPWLNGETVPEEAWDALGQIEERYAESLDIMAKSVRVRLDLFTKRKQGSHNEG